jgi:CBS domain-containing protein
MGVLGDELVDRREDTVRADPHVQQAAKIMESARNQLLRAIVAGDLAESQRLMGIFTNAAVLRDDTEDELRVRLGLLTQDEVASRAVARRATIATPAVPARKVCVTPKPLLALLRRIRLAAVRRDIRRWNRQHGIEALGVSFWG